MLGKIGRKLLKCAATGVSLRNVGRLAEASSAGRMPGSSQLTLELTDIVINGAVCLLLTHTLEVKGKERERRQHGKMFRGVGLGAIIGGNAVGGSGAAVGALAGAAGGTALAASKGGSSCRSLANPYSSFDVSSLCPYRLHNRADQTRPRTRDARDFWGLMRWFAS